MENYIVSVPEGQAQFFKNLFENLRVDYKKYSDQLTDSKKEAILNLKQAIEDVKLAKKGKLDLQSLDEFLDEV